MRKLLTLFVLLFAVTGCAAGAATPTPIDAVAGCTLRNYRKAAEPLMVELSEIASSTNIRDSASRLAARSDVNDLLARIDDVYCKEEFPLKQETLEFAATHFRDALDATGRGDLVEANRALDRSLLNVDRFNDWSVDVDN